VDDGSVPESQPPVIGSDAENWRNALVDGNADGVVNISDITPIGQHYSVHVGGYAIYRRAVGEEEFAQIATVEHPGLYDPRRPLTYSYSDEFSAEVNYEYIVRPYGADTTELGPDSNIALAVPAPGQQYPLVELTAEPDQGQVPLSVSFTATAAASAPATIISYEWDLDDNGEYESTSVIPEADYFYEQAGRFLARVRVTDSENRTGLAGVLITAGDSPTAMLAAHPSSGEVPLTVSFDASASTSVIGPITRFEWDLDGNGSFELDSGLIDQQSAEFLEPGEVTISVRVTDIIGLTDVGQLVLQFTDNYEEEEPNGSFSLATAMGEIALGDDRVWRGNIGAGGYSGDEDDWLRFTITVGCLADISVATGGAGVKLALQLVDVDGISVLAELPAVSASEQFTRGLRGAGEYFIHVVNVNTTTGLNYDYTLEFSLSELTYGETENNDTPAMANDLGTLSASLVPGLWGSLGPDGVDGDDDDWFSFGIAQQRQAVIALDFFHHEADLELALYDHTGEVLLGVSEGVTGKEEIETTLDAGSYLIHCYRRSGGTANYQLAIQLSQ